MSEEKAGATELGILSDMALMMSVYSFAKVFSKAEIAVRFHVMKERLKDQGLDPDNPVVGKVQAAVYLINEGFSKEDA